MLIVDASCLVETLTDGPFATAIEERLAADPDHAAPHIIDVEAFGVIRREYLRGELDRTPASQAVTKLAAWPGARYAHQLLLARAWELRDNARGWDAMCVALAEILDAVLITTDRRLAAARGPTCRIETFGPEQR